MSKKLNYINILGVATVLFLILNLFTPLLADDYSYTKGVDSFKDAYEMWVHAFMTHNGRISNFYCSLFLTQDRLFFNLLNTLVFSLYLYLSIWIIKINTSIKNIYFLSVFVLSVWFFTPVIDETWFWGAGTCNYLWPLVFSLVAVFFFQNSFNVLKQKNNIYFLFLTPFFILAGMGHEAISIGISVGLVVALFMRRERKYWIQAVWVLSYCFGALLIVFSPGTLHRASDAGCVSLSLSSLSQIFTCLLYHIGDLKIFVILSLLLVWSAIYRQKILIRFISRNTVLLIAVYISYVLVAVMGVGYSRVFFFVESLSIVLLFSYLPLIFQSFEIWYKRIFILSFVGFLVSYVQVFSKMIVRFDVVKFNTESFKDSKDVIFPVKLMPYSKYLIYDTFEHTPIEWLNRNRSLYFGKSGIWGMPDTVFHNLGQMEKLCSKQFSINNSQFFSLPESSMIWTPLDKSKPLPSAYEIIYVQHPLYFPSLLGNLKRYQVENTIRLDLKDFGLIVRNDSCIYLFFSKPTHLLANDVFEIKNIRLIYKDKKVHIPSKSFYKNYDRSK